MGQFFERRGRTLIVGNEIFANFKNINEALTYLKEHPYEKREIIILSGRYEERLHIDLDSVVFKGIGDVEIIGGSYAKEIGIDGKPKGTFSTPTIYIEGKDCSFENITFINNAGQGDIVGQAVAVFVHADLVKFSNCQFKGYQDTLCIGPLPPKQLNGIDFPEKNKRRYFEKYRVLFEQCYIEGTIDFVFGGGTAVFVQCELKSLQRLNPNDIGYVTAASTPESVKSGFTFIQCLFTGEAKEQTVYLGRPWRPFAYTELIDCVFGNHIIREGWSEWEQHTPHIEKVRYIEKYSNNQLVKEYQAQRAKWVTVEKNHNTIVEIMETCFE